MRMKRDVALITIIHDKEGLLYEMLNKVVHLFKNYYEYRYAAVSDQTSFNVVSMLKDNGFRVFLIEKNGAGHARRKIVQLMRDYPHEYYHYCDLDRLVTWMLEYPSELTLIQREIPKYDYLILGRTKRAFCSHPKAWIETESIVNKVFTLEFDSNNSNDDIDITAGSCGMSRKALLAIADQSTMKMTDAEWPLIIKNMFGRREVGCLNVDGLLYLSHNQSNVKDDKLLEWTSRLRLAHTICQSIVDMREK